MEQVVSNLLGNAAKYGAGKPVQIWLGEVGDLARIHVRDFGIGIAPQDRGRIFERFERAVSAKSISGLGLGLYISREILRAHGGTIAVDSEVGKGSLFTVEIPLHHPGMVPAAACGGE